MLLPLAPPHDRQITKRRRRRRNCWILRYPAGGPIAIILLSRDRKITPAEEEVLIAVVAVLFAVAAVHLRW